HQIVLGVSFFRNYQIYCEDSERMKRRFAKMNSLQDKTVTVMGLSKRTGVAVVKFLARQKAHIIVSDVKPREELTAEIEEIQDIDLEFDLGGHSNKILQSDLLVVSPGVPLDLPIFSRVKKKGIPVISEIELAFRFTDSRIIGITGTNGKTTTTALTGEIFKAGFAGQVKVVGNIGTPFIQEIDGLSEQDWLIVELSSFQLEAVDKFRPEISVYLNFSPDHLDRHKNEENYWQAKKNIFKQQQKSDRAVINLDDSRVCQAVQDCSAQVYGVSLRQEPEQGIYLQDDDLVLKTSAGKEKIISRSEIPLRGDHNLYNCAFAIMTAHLGGIKKETIRAEIKKFSPFAHRLETVKELPDGPVFIDDSKATNPAAAIKALQAVNKPIILIAGGQDRGADFTEFAAEIKKSVQQLILLGETKNKIEKAVLDTGFNNIYKVDDMEQAVKKAIQKSKSQDCVLLSPGCPSWDMYSSYKQRGEKFQTFVNENI
ncbi:MAG: UDP-N-acetylmuramoyl-L-alanine--D-glutamate ligase, partial [Bacillota bacterium]